MNDEDGKWPRELVTGLGALVAVALVIGGVVSVVALAAADFAGLGSDESSSQQPSLYIPPSKSETPEQTGATPSSDQSEGPSGGPSAGSSPTKKSDDDKQKQHRRRLTLDARPRNGSTYQRVYLTGRFPGGNGTTLQVQRFDGGWADFPVSVTVSGGRFETWVVSGQDGPNRFRVVAPSGKASRPVTVTLR